MKWITGSPNHPRVMLHTHCSAPVFFFANKSPQRSYNFRIRRPFRMLEMEHVGIDFSKTWFPHDVLFNVAHAVTRRAVYALWLLHAFYFGYLKTDTLLSQKSIQNHPAYPHPVYLSTNPHYPLLLHYDIQSNQFYKAANSDLAHSIHNRNYFNCVPVFQHFLSEALGHKSSKLLLFLPMRYFQVLMPVTQAVCQSICHLI